MKLDKARILSALPMVAAVILLLAFILPESSLWRLIVALLGMLTLAVGIVYDLIRSRCPHCGAISLRFFLSPKSDDPIHCSRCGEIIN